MRKHLLVYGTLKSGQHNHILIQDKAKLISKVRVPGFDLYNLGWYPGIRPNPDNKEGVECELYEVADDNTIRAADYYEGYIETAPEISLFTREEVTVNGTDAYIYQYGRDPGGRAFKIEGGVWG